jgi:release factor glutamine methyltransferase
MGVSGSPRLDVQLLLAHALQTTREALIAHPEMALSEVQARTFDSLLALRQHGMPIAYLLGTRPFYDRLFRVTPHVLIPRPETEKLVETALAWCAERQRALAETPQPRPLRIVDIGTGSGVIAVTLAARLPAAQVYATDISYNALLVAAENGAALPNLRLIHADLLAPFSAQPPDRFDLIASNLPYIASAELDILEVAKFEPLVALDGGDDGLNLIRDLLRQIPARLARPGLLLLEHGADQGPRVAALAAAALPGGQTRIIKDDAGLDRFVQVTLPTADD